MIHYTVDQNIAIISWAMTSAPMNVLNDESIPQFEAALQRAYDDDTVSGLIITSAKPEFVAGADLKMILRNSEKNPAEIRKISSELNRIFRSMETSGKPVVAAINGTALGGGYEICLACHQRIALNNPKTLIGLVEVTIGLLPGAGGTQRLPRLVGVETALPLMLEGRRVNVPEALQLGLIDDVANSPEELMTKARAWILANPTPLKPWDKIDYHSGRIVGKDDFQSPGASGQTLDMVVEMATASVQEQTHGNYPAPLEIVACVSEGLRVSIEQGVAIEAQHFVNVATSKVARNLIQTMFLGMNEASKGISRPKNQPRTDVTSIAVQGRNAGITSIAAKAGTEVIHLDTTSAPDFNNCELALVSDRFLSQLPAGQLSQAVLIVASPEQPLADLTAGFENPERILGMNWIPSAEKAVLVELIKGPQTSDQALAMAIDLARKIRKMPIVVRDSPGYYVARCSAVFIDEGQRLLAEGVSETLIHKASMQAGMAISPVPGTEASKSAAGEQPSLDVIKKRLLYRQSLEAVRCLEEGVICTKLEADLGSILGWGFPTYTGGAASFVDFVGTTLFVDTCDQLAASFGDRFLPTGQLRAQASQPA
ncbi:enoyl-CoA hydratase-related protein [Spirosoma sp. KUDC1026]|uniref:enoyl-CoA hydratase-related protein n=1 Tax=Spirosoma sp. KUDC1026 TaxID=2745947 RepID=UPI00159BE411|nr:enoyl-CoA hydratase-related protein [Spirosoma sp. KUDC1026]QKZ15536.1 enoyl-CoA hydratase/isomerase family protein [Spirosoma sp. KUDC1026]